jgi:hypothetical protein
MLVPRFVHKSRNSIASHAPGSVAVFVGELTFLPLVAGGGPAHSSCMTTNCELRQRRGIAYTARKVAVTVRDIVRDVNTAQQALWDSYQRLETATNEPPDDEILHWEPTMSGWRLYGDRAPD